MWMMGEAMGGDEAMPDEMAEEVKQPQRAVSPTGDIYVIFADVIPRQMIMHMETQPPLFGY